MIDVPQIIDPETRECTLLFFLLPQAKLWDWAEEDLQRTWCDGESHP